MIDLMPYKKIIQHDPDRKGNIEASTKSAIQLDGNSGLASDLGFNANILKKVDYFRSVDNNVYLIELTNLQDDIKECIECDELLKNSAEVIRIVKEVDSKGLKSVQKKLWMEILEEFKGKWMGSIAAYERLLRKNPVDEDPVYHLVVILKDDTDIKDRDLLQTTLNNKLVGMTATIDVRLTKEV